jgi:hypothetical protein
MTATGSAPVDRSPVRAQTLYMSCGECRTTGENGVAAGRWREYRCAMFPLGLDVVYPLYVR